MYPGGVNLSDVRTEILILTYIDHGSKHEENTDTWLVVEPTHLKNMLVKFGNIPQF